jgi:hypothetical protein
VTGRKALARDDYRAYVVAARDTLAPKLTGRHEHANCASAVARRCVLNPRGASRKRRQKGDDGTFPRLSLRSSTRRNRPRSRRRSQFAASDSYRGRHDNHAWCRKFESPLHHRTENPAALGDFGPWNGETRTRTGDTTIFSRAVGDGQTHAILGNHAILRWPELQVEVRYLRAFARSSGDGGVSSPFSPTLLRFGPCARQLILLDTNVCSSRVVGHGSCSLHFGAS